MDGSRPRVWMLCAAALAGGAPAQDQNVVERIGKRYRVEFHAGNLEGAFAGAIAERALAEVEGAWRSYKKLLGAKDQKPTTIVLYRDEKEFRAVEKGGAWPFLLEGFVGKDGTGHVLLFPVLSGAVLARVCLPPAAREELLRVAAEVAVRSAIADSGVVDIDDWLCWLLTMGALEGATNPAREPGVDAAYDLRRALVCDRLAEDPPLALESMQNFELAPKERYLWDWMLTFSAVTAELCADANPAWARKMLVKPKSLKGRVDRFKYRAAAMTAVFGDLARADVRFTKQQRDYAPKWEMCGPSWGADGARMMLVAGEAAASVTVRQPLPAGDFAISCRLEVGPGADCLRIVLPGPGKDVFGIVFFGDELQLSVWDLEKKKWTDKAVYRPGRGWPGPFDVRAEITAEAVRVAIDGVERVAWKHGGMDLHKEWSLEANDRVAWFENVRVEPLPPVKK